MMTLLKPEGKRVVVLGLGSSGQAAAILLGKRGAQVTLLDSADTPELRVRAQSLNELGISTTLGALSLPLDPFDALVVSPGVPPSNPIYAGARSRGIPILGELELGYQHSLCLNIAITGTNGKTTTTELVEKLLTAHRLKTVAAGNIGRPVCAVVDQTRDLDFLTLEVSSFQLETTQFFRPVIGVLTNITPDHFDRYASREDYARTKARLFQNQQAFDWAIVQWDALAELRALGVDIPSKVITFSATHREADLWLDRSLIVSRVDGFSGPLLDLDRCQLRGPHNVENLMAALLVGRLAQIPSSVMVEVLTAYAPAPHRCERIAEIGGVQFINDSKATNVDALHKALLSIPSKNAGQPNIWVIAGGKDKGFDYHEVGPLLSQRVKGAFLIGESREKIRRAWGLFTPCALVDSLLEAVQEAARNAVAGDVVLLSPACSSFDQFQNYQHRGDVFRRAVLSLQS